MRETDGSGGTEDDAGGEDDGEARSGEDPSRSENSAPTEWMWDTAIADYMYALHMEEHRRLDAAGGGQPPGSESVPHRRRRWWQRWRRRPDEMQDPHRSDTPGGSSDAEARKPRPVSDPLPEIGWTVDPDFDESEWAELCHRLDSRRSRHEPGLEHVQTLFERPTSERSLYQCRHCGLIYLREWHEMNDWGAFGDRTEEIVLWYPISEREVEAARRSINYEPSPRNHLVFRDRY